MGTEEIPGVLVVSHPAKAGETGRSTRSTRKPIMKVETQSLGGMSMHLECPVQLTSIAKPQKPLQNMLDKKLNDERDVGPSGEWEGGQFP
jgi:hypothetical protein